METIDKKVIMNQLIYDDVNFDIVVEKYANDKANQKYKILEYNYR